MKNRFYCFLCAFILVHSLLKTCSAMKTTNIFTDQSALLALKAYIISDPYNSLTKNWSDSTYVCDWIGVDCGSRRHRITALNISNMGLAGTVPPQLGNLSFLVSLDVGSNHFQGNLPQELLNLRRLRFVSLSFNSFAGEIPMWFGLLPQLQFLSLSSNSFSGFIPTSISNLSKLETLNLTSNFLEGNIPEQLGNLSILKELYLSRNQLVGQIPSSLCRCLELQSLYLSFNKLSGLIPKQIGKLEKLKHLILGTNNLTGIIPPEMFNLQNLKGLYLENNRILGNIPREIGNLTMLNELYLNNNSLTGIIPHEISNLIQLEELRLGRNSLNGSIPAEMFNLSALKRITLGFNLLSGNLPSDLGYRLPNLIVISLDANNLGGVIPKSITNCSKLTSLSLPTNQFSGTIPHSLGDLRLLEYLFLFGNNLTIDPASSELGFITSLTKCKNLEFLALDWNPLNGLLPVSIGNLSTSLKKFYAGTCEIKGTIPSQIGNLTNLILLSLQENHLSGVIPTEFKGLKNLQALDLEKNNLRGSLDILCNLPSLSEFHLGQNRISGSIPVCFGNMTSLRILDLGNNSLGSAIPRTFWNLKDLLLVNLSSNSLNGSLPQEIGNLKVAISIDISVNQFSGNIPSTIGDLQSLIFLFLSRNQFQGPIPESFGKMLSLEALDMSHNNLFGHMPKSLEALQYLKKFDVSYNHLTGEIPSGGPFRNFTGESYMFNDEMCGDSKFDVPLCPRTSIHRPKTKKVLLIVFASLGFTTVVVVAVAFVLRRHWKKEVNSKGTNMVSIPTQERISYYELLQATDGYNESNMLGSGSFGSVYKGFLNDGRSIAVKVFNLGLEGAIKSFDVECDVLRNVRHRNLVKVISSCSNQDFKALVLEYMSNGSLEKWLYFDNYFLDILQRLSTMIDVASALQYLHEEYLMPVIHCDLKPSNVLLDEDMVAHISDFGIAKLLGKEESFGWTKTLATIGYIAPEYGSDGLTSTKCDVYSYGIMLMELFTRRRPSDAIFAGNLNLKSWINDSMPDSILSVIDANLLKPNEEHFPEKLEVLSSIMEQALNCVHDSPMERPSMKDVLETLKKIKLKFLRVMEVDN